MKICLLVTLLFCVHLIGLPTQAYEDRSFYVGLHPLSLGLVDRVTAQDSGKAETLGTLELTPLVLGGTFSMGFDSYFSPHLVTNWLMTSKTNGGEIEKGFIALLLSWGRNFGSSLGGWDWNLTPGLMQMDIKGSGSLYTDGGGASFYYPSDKRSLQLFTLGAGVGCESGAFRFGSDLVFFDFLNSKKRSMNLFFTFAWRGSLR